MIRIGLLGAGFMGGTHAAAYSQLPGARLVAVADANRALADALAAKYSASAYYEIEALLADPNVDAVDVCLPTFLHERCVVGAANAGKHLLCEKPIALSLEQVDNMLAAVNKAGVIAMVGQVIRFWPEYVAIRRLLKEGTLGTPKAAHAVRLSAPPAWGNWFKDPKLSGGGVLDLHIHDLDYTYWLLGMPSSVYAVGVQSPTGAWDHVSTSLTCSGVPAFVEGSLSMPEGFPFQMLYRLIGSEATVEYRFRVLGQVGERSQAETELMLYRPGKPAEKVATEAGDAYAREIEYYVGCVAAGKQPEVATLAEARAPLSIALAARHSMDTGEIVHL